MKLYDSVIIGGGFAGISSAIYLGRYNRSVLMVDHPNGRWDTHELNENYLGFPNGILAKKLRDLGLKQAINFNAEYFEDEINNVKRKNNIFEVEGKSNQYKSRTIILATGVTDLFPYFENWKEYVGKSLFWCITCDGYKTIGKHIVIVGQNDEAAVDAMQFLNFTNKIIFVTNKNPGHNSISKKRLDNLKHANIPFFEGIISNVTGENGMFRNIELNTGIEIAFDLMFSKQGCVPNTKIAKKLGVKLDKKGYILIDLEQRTNLPFVYAAGDVTKPFSHQVISAAYEGSQAAMSANYDLYNPEQKED